MGLDPVTIGAVSFGAQLLGGAVKAFSDFGAGQDQARADAFNARLADRAAADATARGEEEAVRVRGSTDRLIGHQRTAYGASGVSISEGSPLDVMVGSRAVSERDIRTARTNAARESWGYQQQADDFRRRSDASNQGSYFNLGGQLFAGATSTLLGANDLLAKVGGKKK